VHGVSTRKVERLVERLGLRHLSKDQVSRRCRGLDEQVRVSRERPLGAPTLPVGGRQGGAGPRAGRGAPQGAGDRLRRACLGPSRGARLGRGPGRDRGVLAGVPPQPAGPGAGRRQAVPLRRPVGLGHAIAQLLGCRGPRCAVHFPRDLVGHVARAQPPLVSGAIRGSCTATSAAEARQRLGQVVEQLPARAQGRRAAGGRPGRAAGVRRLPGRALAKLRSTHPLERVNREIGRRLEVVGSFPNHAALLRLAGLLVLEQNDEWLVGRGSLSASSMALVIAGNCPDPSATTSTQEVAQLTAS
jgi:putative transposase